MDDIEISINPVDIIDYRREKYKKVKREDSVKVIEVYVNNCLKKYIICYLDSGCTDHVFIVNTGGKNMRPVSKVSLKGVAETILKVEKIGD